MNFKNKNSTKSYHGFKTYFLCDKIILKFDETVKVIRCHGGGDEDIRLAVTSLHPKDRTHLYTKAAAMLAVFPGGGKTFKDMLTGDNEVLYIKADNAQLFNHRGELDDIANLPKVSTCHMAIEILGMKKQIKDEEVSFMVRAYQLKIAEETN
jgi:hypothetical protein